MSADRPNPAAVRQLLKLAGGAGGHATDRELLERFVQDRSEGAFADLMARHGPMVLAVCKRHLRDAHSAEDAFQATFIVLARKAGAVKWKQSIGGWLFEVATRVARKAAGQSARRTAREGGSADTAPEPAAPPVTAPSDLTSLQAVLDDELRNLPEKLRTPVVLCHLEGLSQEEVARHLGVSDGQLRGRLYRAKERLRERLLHRGFSLSAVLLALGVGAAAQAVPPLLASGTLRLVRGAADSVPNAVHLLATGVIRDMTTSFKTVAALTVFGVLGLAAAGFAVRSAVADAPRPAETAPPVTRNETLFPLPPAPKLPKAPKPVAARKAEEKKEDDKRERVWCRIKGVDATKKTLTVKLDEGEQETTIELQGEVALRFAGQPVKLSDLQPGMRAELVYPVEQVANTPVEVRASWPRRGATVKALDLAGSTLTIQTGGDDGFEVVLKLAPGARVNVDELPAGLADVPVGGKVELDLSLDKKGVLGIKAEGEKGDLPALVKSYDAAAGTLLVEFDAEANDFARRVTLCLPVSANAKVRLAGADAKLADLKERMPVRLRMTADRKSVAAVLAAPPLPADKEDDQK